MNILKKWRNRYSESPFNDLKKILLNRSKEEQFAIINGTYLQLEEINPLQLVLLWNEPVKYKKVFFKLIDLGANVNKLSNKGLNLIHLFLFLFYFSENVQSHIDECLELFLEILNYGFNPSQAMCLSNISLTYIDLLISLQKKNENIKQKNRQASFYIMKIRGLPFNIIIVIYSKSNKFKLPPYHGFQFFVICNTMATLPLGLSV